MRSMVEGFRSIRIIPTTVAPSTALTRGPPPPSSTGEDGRTSELAASRQRLDPIGGAAGDRLDGQRRIDAADGRKHRAVANPEIGNVPRAAIGVDDAGRRIRSEEHTS